MSEIVSYVVMSDSCCHIDLLLRMKIEKFYWFLMAEYFMYFFNKIKIYSMQTILTIQYFERFYTKRAITDSETETTNC